MRIITLGCSWTSGWGIENSKTWPSVLGKLMNADVTNLAISGADNMTQLHKFFEHNASNLFDCDLAIFGLTSPARIQTGDGNSQVGIAAERNHPELREAMLPMLNYNFLMVNYASIIIAFQSFCEANCIDHYCFRVFEDARPSRFSNLIQTDKIFNYYLKPGSMYEWLIADNHGHFKDRMDLYEPGYLYEKNTGAEIWLDQNMPSNWRRGQVEREHLCLEEKFFDETGHPNEESHERWAMELLNHVQS